MTERENDEPLDYELLDFGRGRKLERFGPVVLDRPSPAAEGFSRQTPRIWNTARLTFVLDAHTPSRRAHPLRHGRWIDGSSEKILEPWTIACPRFSLELKCSPFGHLGIFPEQCANWQRIFREIAYKKKNEYASKPFRVLNLFAYTGGGTLAAAAAGAQVVHIDSAKNLIPWARRNAELSGLAEAPIRWIAEDATRFVQREIKRGSQYEAVILDPPSFGRGPRGEQWNLARDLPTLLESCFALMSETPGFMLLTNHSPHCDAATLARLVQQSLGRNLKQNRKHGRETPASPEGSIATHEAALEPLNMDIRSRNGAFLPAGYGVFVRLCDQRRKS